MEIIDLQAIKEIFGKNSFIGFSCYISHGLPSDTLTVEMVLELPEIWTLLHQGWVQTVDSTGLDWPGLLG